MSLIEITPESHGVELMIAYATADNFTGVPVYRRPGCYLRPDAEALLRRAVGLAARQGWRFRIFDAFRPTEAQWKLWDHTPDPVFLADPRKGSPHSRGVAVDLTLIDSGSGRALDMGTGFDNFTPMARHGNTEVPETAQENRYRLLGLMTAAGWDCYLKEWWHYQMFNARDYGVLSDETLPEPMMG